MTLQRAVRTGNATSFKFVEKGDSLKGYYLGTSDIFIDDKAVKQHTFKNSEGLFTVLGQADLYKQLTENNCQKCYVEITFSGEMLKLPRNRTMKIYTVDFNLSDKYDGQEESADAANEPEPDFVGDSEEDVSDPLPARPTAPRSPARTPSADAVARARAQLSGKAKTA